MTADQTVSPLPGPPAAVPAGVEHLEGMVACHLAAFPGEFLSLLGRSVLRAMYRFYIRQAGGICLVTVDRQTGRVSGLVAGGAPQLRARFIRRHVLGLAAAALLKALTHPRVRRRLGEHLARAFRALARKLGLARRSGGHLAPPEDPPGTWSNLLSVCTHPDFRGRGLGVVLMEAFAAESARRGYRTMRLSVHNDNAAAIALYRRCGWKPIMVVPSGTYFKRSIEPAQ